MKISIERLKILNDCNELSKRLSNVRIDYVSYEDNILIGVVLKKTSGLESAFEKSRKFKQ